MSLVRIDWHPDRPALRRFGRTVLLGCALIAAALGWGRGAWTAARWVAGAGLVVGGAGLSGVRPLALPLYRLWMGVGFVMGTVVSHVLMAAVWYLVLTPIGLVLRLAGRDPLQRRGRGAATFWHDLPDRPVDHERQF